MEYIARKFQSFIDKVRAHEINLNGELLSIANENLFSICLDKDQVAELKLEDIEALICTIETEMVRGKTALFYCWFDLMLAQLRFSVIPSLNEPPFKCNIKIVHSVHEVAEMAYIEWRFRHQIDDVEYLVTNHLPVYVARSEI